MLVTRGEAKKGQKTYLLQRGMTMVQGQVPGLLSLKPFRRAFRWYNTSALTAETITSSNVSDIYLVALTATTGACLMNSFRVKRLTVWVPPPASSAAPDSVTIELPASAGISGSSGPGRVLTGSTLGNTFISRVDVQPTVAETAWFWQDKSSGPINLFRFTLPSQCLFELDLEFSMYQTSVSDVESITNALVGATPGMIYQRGLDGLATASSKFDNVGTGGLQQ